MIKRLLLGLSALVLLAAPALAAPPPNVSYTVGVCDPLYGTRCIKPATDGSIPVTVSGGSAIIGTVKIDQTTPGTTNGVVTNSGSVTTATLAAGEAHVGEVGGNTVNITVAQTVTASSAYTSGNAIGGLMTLASAARVSTGSGLIQSVINYSKSAQSGQVDVFLFNANPSGSTCTDKTAFVLATADFDKVIGVAHITDWTAGNVASVGQAQSLAIPFALPSGTSAYACAVTRSTPTYTATTDVSIGFRVLRN